MRNDHVHTDRVHRHGRLVEVLEGHRPASTGILVGLSGALLTWASLMLTGGVALAADPLPELEPAHAVEEVALEVDEPAAAPSEPLVTDALQRLAGCIVDAIVGAPSDGCAPTCDPAADPACPPRPVDDAQPEPPVEPYPVIDSFTCSDPVCARQGLEGSTITIVAVPTYDDEAPILRVNLEIAALVHGLVERAHLDGVDLSTRGCDLRAVSCDYRSRSEQQQIWDDWCSPPVPGCGSQISTPGSSNHGIGLAIDFTQPAMQDWMRSTGQHLFDESGQRLLNALPGDPVHFSVTGT